MTLGTRSTQAKRFGPGEDLESRSLGFPEGGYKFARGSLGSMKKGEKNVGRSVPAKIKPRVLALQSALHVPRRGRLNLKNTRHKAKRASLPYFLTRRI